ncbi:aKG-HExxH-type peptide beta-hydroxylase [Actinophytocola sp.]|uniref:aKG-HExxH-type peptide beta-hydroxylase n=1 Tax=Actinophytocola sp. TaxID=1872138 RepID=UPI002DDCE6E7|nr:HEXXH motif-containing putative peptide modification protein [Actinophytocola sp.]
MPELTGPFSSPEAAWELLARVEARSSATFNLLLAHPYTGSWSGYTTRLVHSNITGVCPLWMHVGHLHAIAAAAAIRARLNFEISVPLWNGNAILPSLGLVNLPTAQQHAVAKVVGENGQFEVSNGIDRVRLPSPLDQDAPGWWSIRRATATTGGRRLALWLDDVDPYRGLYGPVPPQRLDPDEVGTWRCLLEDAWQLIVRHLPKLARAIPVGLDSLVPAPSVPFRNPSASSGEAFGSALVARPTDAASLAATLIHEFQHIVLGGVLHLTRLYDDDPRERFYVPWRDDPRPLNRVLQGIYAFFGVTAFWRALARAGEPAVGRRAAFEFAYWRGQTWRVLGALREDASLTSSGRRFINGIAAQLGPWQSEPLPADTIELAEAMGADHHAGWRIRHLRPDPVMVAELTTAWLAGRSRPPVMHTTMVGSAPTPVPDGSWSSARVDLIRLAIDTDRRTMRKVWSTMPGATVADLAYATGQVEEAIRQYSAELRTDPDRPASWTGLGIALARTGERLASGALLHHPELVRAVYRSIRASGSPSPGPVDLAAWIGRAAH